MSKYTVKYISKKDIHNEDNPITTTKHKTKSIDIEDYEFGKIPFHCSIIGSSGSGKTVWIKRFLQLHGKKWDKIIVICGSKDVNNDYDFIEPDNLLDPRTDMKKLFKLIEYCREVKKEGHTYNVLLLFDDIIGLIDSNKGIMAEKLNFLISQFYCEYTRA
jgi:ABC-type dipeptide/oligopeptide/nickel transport system ATPase component